ncbi:hypothetical protein CASFOL_004486 [Castilleja foliolosa]|uniref:KIB1-4 beta-propeller domain-containing protein n=1 Tax=Castilleja foliolosa TaxID=1961234 RepID=A0ABD3EEN6_9LAMI
MAFSFSSLLRPICVEGVFGSSSSNHRMLGEKWSARSGATTSFSNHRMLGGKWSARSGATTSFKLRGVCTASATTASDHPWLMLSPKLKGGTMSNNFYSLADSMVHTPASPSDVIRNRVLTCRGSSHGWLALVSPQDDQLFLYNPISGRHINLPSIVSLPRLPEDDAISRRDVAKLILSCSPDEDEENCRAVVINGCGNTLAFCCPGRSKEWTIIFDKKRGRRDYVDIVYSDKQKLFFVLADCSRIETWDLGDSSRPKFIKADKVDWTEYFRNSSIKKKVKCLCGRAEYLVVANGDLLLVIRYILDYVGPDGQCFDHLDERRPDYMGEHKCDLSPVRCHHMTIGFDIWKHDPKNRNFKYLDSSSLGDLAIFVGLHSHSAAIQASEFPEVKPGSIYFTDGYYTGSLEGGLEHDGLLLVHGGHDIGIYNYKDRTVSPCYYPCDAPSVKSILPAPIWFFPS